MKKNIRLKDIADALHVSIATVSKALNDRDDVSAETKKAVLELAERYDYKPNYFAKFLHKGENNLIGLIIPQSNHSFFADMIDGVLTAANKNNYLVVIAESDDDEDKEKELIAEYLALHTCGLIVAPAKKSSILSLQSNSKKQHKNVVVIDRFSTSHPYHQITNNHYQASQLAVQHLVDQGYKRIAHIGGGVSNDSIADRIRNGYIDAIQDIYDPLVVNLTPVNPENAMDAVEQLMASEQVPDAIFCISDEAALGVYRYCYTHSIDIPRQMGLVGFSNTSFSNYLTPSLTTIDQRSKEMGEFAIQLIHEQKEKYSKVNKVFNSDLIVRESSILKI